MSYTDSLSPEIKQRIIQELVPGKQISLAHIIANPDQILYKKLGLDPAIEYSRSAIGIMTITPAETAIIMGDIAIKSSGVELGFVDRFSGSLIVTGTVSQVEARGQCGALLCAGDSGIFCVQDHAHLTKAEIRYEENHLYGAQRSGQDDPYPGDAR